MEMSKKKKNSYKISYHASIRNIHKNDFVCDLKNHQQEN